MSDIKHNFASNLIKLRKSRKMNQIELGEAIHYSSKAISKWENEETIPDIDVLLMIADYFEITVDELISNKDVVRKSYKKRNHFFITLSSALLPFFIALLIFSFLYIFKLDKPYLSFVAGGMASAITLIVFTSLWYTKTERYISVCYLIVCSALLVMLIIDFEYWWIIVSGAVLLMLLFFVFFMIKITHRKKGK